MATITLTVAANEAAQLLGILDSGESLSTQQIADALLLANQLLDNWSSDPKKILSLTKVQASTTAALQSYTIGTGQNFNVTRPVQIVGAAFINPAGPGGPIHIATAPEWAAIPDRQSQSWIIEKLFYDRGNPTGNVYLSPVPLGILTVELLTWAALAPFVDATTPLTMLPGYVRLLVRALAIEMAPQFDVAVQDTLAAGYKDALDAVEELNASLFGTLTDSQRSQVAAAAGGK